MNYRVVVDTNLVISALLWGGQPRLLLNLIVAGSIALLVSSETLEELEKTLRYEKFAARFQAIGQTVEAVISDYRHIVELVVATNVSEQVIRAPKDRIILGAAAGGSATHIITGDKDLLILGNYEQIPIVTAVQFIALIDEHLPPV